MPADARSLFLLFTYSSRRRLFINQTFFEQLAKGSSARCSFPAVVWKGTNTEQQRRKRISFLAPRSKNPIPVINAALRSPLLIRRLKDEFDLLGSIGRTSSKVEACAPVIGSLPETQSSGSFSVFELGRGVDFRIGFGHIFIDHHASGPSVF
jgi:hypothetical protein